MLSFSIASSVTTVHGTHLQLNPYARLERGWYHRMSFGPIRSTRGTGTFVVQVHVLVFEARRLIWRGLKWRF